MEHRDWSREKIVPRVRVISDNDYGGDPDGLVQLAHLLLSPGVEVRGVISSHLGRNDPLADDSGRGSAERGAAEAQKIATLCHRADLPILAGSERPLQARDAPRESQATTALIAEAMREDTNLPLFVTCGGSLTEIASAWLLEPRIAERLTLIWIGGHEYAELAEPPPGGGSMEYNTGLDPVAAQVVFNDSKLTLWQVPRSTYRMAIASRAELLQRMRPAGALGAHLFGALGGLAELVATMGIHVGETYVLGDSPLVLLTALWTGFEPGPASSPSIRRPCPRIEASGRYTENPDGRPIRIFTGLDTRLLFEDFYAKLTQHAEAKPQRP